MINRSDHLSICDNVDKVDVLALSKQIPSVTTIKSVVNANSSAFTTLNNCPNVLITQDTVLNIPITKDPVDSIIPKLMNKDFVAPSAKLPTTTPTIHKINHNKMTNEITISTPSGKTLTLMTNNVRNFSGPRPTLPTVTNKTLVTYPKPSTLPTRVIPAVSSDSTPKVIIDLPMKTPPQRTYARVSPSTNPVNISLSGTQITINKMKVPPKETVANEEDDTNVIAYTIVPPLSLELLKSEVEPPKKVTPKRLNAGVMQKALQKVESELLGSATKCESPKTDSSIDNEGKKVIKKKRIPMGNRFSYMKFSPELPTPASDVAPELKVKPVIINLTSEKKTTSLLLCDEEIDSNSPDGSPENSKKSTDSSSEVAPDITSITNVKQNLDRKLSVDGNLMIDEEMSVDDVKIEVPIVEEKTIEVFETNDVSQKLEETVKPVTTSMDYDEFLSKSEIPKSTINNESLPVKKLRTKGRGKYVRKPKADKEEKSGVELEQEYNDPLKYIKWNDGVGTLKQCKKQFGFNEFGMIEILNQNEIHKNRNKTYDTTATDGLLIKLEDKYHCCICKKTGDIREFVMNEYCSEACVAIGKRKRNEKESEKQGDKQSSSSNSGINTPTDIQPGLIFGGGVVSTQQLHQHFSQQIPDFSIVAPQVLAPEPPRKKNRRKSQLTSTKLNQANRFQWSNYLTAKSVPAPLSLFPNPYPKSSNPFYLGMKLEAIDPENQSLFCVCTVKDKQGYRIKLHFDGSTQLYDFWVNADSKSIFPAGFCRSTARTLQAPPKFKINFNWAEYLVATNSVSAHRNCFIHFGTMVSY